MNEKLSESLATGGHARLAGLSGDWQGTTRTWFEPGKLANEAEVRGNLRLVLGGRFLLHEYECSMQGKPEHGLAIYGYHIDGDMYEAAWIDDIHTGTAIQFAQGNSEGGDIFNVFGSYFAGEGEPRWGWRTKITQAAPEKLLIAMYNVPPGEEEAIAVVFDYRRK